MAATPLTESSVKTTSPAPPVGPPAPPTTPTRHRSTAAAGSVSASLLDTIAAHAPNVDGNPGADRRSVLKSLADDGALDLGLPGSAGGYRDQAQVLGDLAGVCMTTAFCAWAHRMTSEYLVRHGGPDLAPLADDVRRAHRPGSTALAGTLRAAVGLATLPVTVDSTGATGTIPWASNLHDNAVVVTGAEFTIAGQPQKALIAFGLSTPGVEVRPVTGLLALDASQSGIISLDDMPVDPGGVLACDFDTFVASVRPPFLALQTAFALGLAAASLRSAGEPQGPATALTPRVAALRGELSRLETGLDEATRSLDAGDRPPLRPLLQLRLDAAHLAVEATQIELCLNGGAAYAAASPTARRLREALFLPVQSPTEVQLQWELQQLQ